MTTADELGGGAVQERVVCDWPIPAVLRLTLSRPGRHNAVDQEFVDGLRAAFEEEAPRAAAVILRAEGSFCSGIDLGLSPDSRRSVSGQLYELYALMVTHERVILAAASGHAIGAGAQLLLASDLRVASPDLVVRFPGPEHGLAVGTWGLPALVGRGRALELALTMRAVNSDEALRIGLVDRLAEDPDSEVLDIARAISELDREAVTSTKALVAAACGLKESLAREALRNGTADRAP